MKDGDARSVMDSISSKRRSLEAIKPFRLVKYISLTSLAAILVGTLLLSGFISKRSADILLKKSENYALLVVENLNHQVYYQFTLPTLVAEGEIRLIRTKQYELLDRVVRNTIHGFSIQRVNIYDPNQVLTYSTETEALGQVGSFGEPFQRALREETVSVLTKDGPTFLGLLLEGASCTLVTYMPMWEERRLSYKRGKVLGVFEITQNVTEDYLTIQRFQVIIVLSFLAFVTLLLIAISLISRRAERILRIRATERKKLEEQLQQTERLAALGEMIAGVSHEIRNPLGIIRSTAELLHGRIENDRQKRLSSIIIEESSRLNDIVTEFLDFARPKVPRMAPCRLEDILERNLHAIEAQCQMHSVTVERLYETGDYTMEADSDLLYRAFINLFANALQAMPEGGTLRVRTVQRNGINGEPRIELRIRDSGKGIPEEVRKKIFNPFFTTRETGTGLGLAIVQSILDSHNGEIEARSRDGNGTVMIIRLPMKQPKEQEPIMEASA
ncbi:MAG: nitrogen regulation protein NR(II) [Syntrophobacteraceae bacterium]